MTQIVAHSLLDSWVTRSDQQYAWKGGRFISWSGSGATRRKVWFLILKL